MEREFIKNLSKDWLAKWDSPVVCQKRIGDFTGGLIQNQTFANLNSQNKGPEGKFYIRGQACWKTEDVLTWLLESFSDVKRRKVKTC